MASSLYVGFNLHQYNMVEITGLWFLVMAFSVFKYLLNGAIDSDLA